MGVAGEERLVRSEGGVAGEGRLVRSEGGVAGEGRLVRSEGGVAGEGPREWCTGFIPKCLLWNEIVTGQFSLLLPATTAAVAVSCQH